MPTDRRSVLLGSISTVAAGASSSNLFAQTLSSGDEFRTQYGGGNRLLDSAALKFLKQAQELGTIAPSDISLYGAYLDNLPLMRLINTGVGTEYHHLMQWHAFALELTALDHTALANPESAPNLQFAEQYGPHRAARALAIIHIAIFEAVNAIYRSPQSYRGIRSSIFADTGLKPHNLTPQTVSVRAAIAAAAHDTMVALYPHKTPFIQALFDKLAIRDPDQPELRRLGAMIGGSAAKQILLLRKYDFQTFQFRDGSQSDGNGGIIIRGRTANSLSLEPRFGDLFPAARTQDWQVDPIHPTNTTCLGGYWAFVDPFALDPGRLFLPPGPPALDSTEFQNDYASVRSLGGDPTPVAIGDRYPTNTTRTGTAPGSPLDATNETFKGIFWGYDGTSLLCAPPRLYNMIATSVALDEFPITRVLGMARYLALINIVLADAGIAAWTAKYQYKFARPVTYIRQTGPDQVITGTPNRQWTPLGAPITNGTPVGTNTTPPFPSYPSGHAAFGGALFAAMRLLLPVGSGASTAFKFVSDEYNGLNRGPTGDLRPYVERQFQSFEAAETENAQSRIWLGIHWQFDADDGRAQGHGVAKYVVAHALSDSVV